MNEAVHGGVQLSKMLRKILMPCNYLTNTYNPLGWVAKIRKSFFLPSNSLVIVCVKVSKGPGPEVSPPVGRRQGVTASDTHVPENHTTRCFLLTLDLKKEIKIAFKY